MDGIEYKAQMASGIINGEVRLSIDKHALTASALFDVLEIPFAEINDIKLSDYVVTVKSDSGDYIFSKMGNWCQPFHDSLYGAYNEAVLRSLFVKGAPLKTAKGDYSYEEEGLKGGNTAVFRLYDNCVAALPPDLFARRIPLCFVRDMAKQDFGFTLKLDTGESYTFSKLGYDTGIFVETVESRIRALREKSLAAIKEMDPSLSVIQASRIAGIMPEGAAAPMDRLAEIAPSFSAAVEAKISQTRAGDSYTVFKKLCGSIKIWVGLRKNDNLRNENDNENENEEADPYMLWLTVPSPNGQFAAVEFAEDNTATYVYKTRGDFDNFALRLNHGLEAVGFRSEAIRLSDEALRDPQKADYFMAAKRNAALKFVRENFAGRVIHSSPEAWERKLTELWGGGSIAK